jgi:adenylate cyclase
MGPGWQIRIYDQYELVATLELNGGVELGRQSGEQESLHGRSSVSGRQRIVIAPREDASVSRQQAYIEPLPPPRGGFQITNLSRTLSMRFQDGTELEPLERCWAAPESLLQVGNKTLRIGDVSGPGASLKRLAEPTLAPGQIRDAPMLTRMPTAASSTSIEVSQLTLWLQAAMDVLQGAASSQTFFKSAAQALVDLVNLDTGRVVLLKNDQWQIQAHVSAIPSASASDQAVPRTVLKKMAEEKRTLWQIPELSPSTASSLIDIKSIVAAPILDACGNVIGALYGQKRHEVGRPQGGSITELEALLVEVLASGVAAGLSRLEQEKAALAARVQFEQFFTPELSRQLSLHPDLLNGRDAEVTIVFCDIRGFSRISENLGPNRTVEWINDVMSVLSDVVRQNEGVLVDYIGDELMAMWGAPESQPDHAERACKTALAMLDELRSLNEKWQPILNEPLELGIGINTGVARVGNTGSRQKFKYGPLGNTVNLASRVQGATKYFKTRVLITGSVQARLDSNHATRRLCQVRVVNIAEPVTLYELFSQSRADWPLAKGAYETALKEFENKNFARAAGILGNLRSQRPDDAPALLLLYRAVHCMVEEPVDFDPVWVLPGK